jgi:heme-degrading monooxygenase HmoA
MIARMWRGWAAADAADEIASHLRREALTTYSSSPGNVSVSILLRPSGGGVELMTLTVWESEDAVPSFVEEDHPLLVARQTVPDRWEIATTAEAIVRAA